jgi:nuclear pore complex protein Nup188
MLLFLEAVGKPKLISSRSWKSTFHELSRPDFDAKTRLSTNLEQFLSDEQCANILKQPFKAFSPSTKHTQSSFETSTAAINVTPTPNGNYNIAQIKEDAQWLSKEASVNELVALRIVIIEWQSRSETKLLHGFSEEESASIQEAAGGNNLRTSMFLPKSSLLSSGGNGFDSSDSRRLRLLRVYLSERRHLAKVAEIVYRAGLGVKELRLPIVNGKESTTTLQSLGAELLRSRFKALNDQDMSTILMECIEALRQRVDELQNGSSWYKDQDPPEDIEMDWGRTKILEMIHTMQIMFDVLEVSETITTHSVVHAWFQFASDCAFFHRFSPVSIGYKRGH